MISALLCVICISCHSSKGLVSVKTSKADKEYSSLRVKKIDKLTVAAYKLIGKAYKLGASGPKEFDCSGFTCTVFQSIKMTLPRQSSDQSKIGTFIKLRAVSPGDLLFFGSRSVDHVAIVTKVDDGSVYMIHATSGAGIVEEILQDSQYWMKRYKSARRVII